MIFKKLRRKVNKESEKPKKGIYPDDFTDYEISLIEKVKGLTMTSPERIVSLIRSIDYIINNNIPGDFVECGVWRGGNAIIMAKILQELKVKDRKIWLYDTFEGMTYPTKEDIDYFGSSAETLLDKHKGDENSLIWAYCSINQVKQNIVDSGCSLDRIQFIKGDILKTLPAQIPGKISLLRLDTDWYESTKHELTHLYPRVFLGGITIIDDFGHWEGAKKATLEYFKENNIKVFLNRIDMTGRLIVKN